MGLEMEKGWFLLLEDIFLIMLVELFLAVTEID